MTRRNHVVLAALFAMLVLGACQQTSAPVRRDIVGSWESQNLQGFVVRMTIAEVARSIDGAGGWTQDGNSLAFRVFGAIANDEVSLYFEFEDSPDLTFQGFFSSGDQMDGVLFGGEFQNQPISFVREALPR